MASVVLGGRRQRSERRLGQRERAGTLAIGVVESQPGGIWRRRYEVRKVELLGIARGCVEVALRIFIEGQAGPRRLGLDRTQLRSGFPAWGANPTRRALHEHTASGATKAVVVLATNDANHAIKQT